MRLYLVNASWLFLEKLLKLSVAFILLGLIAKKIGPDEFGILSFGMSLSVVLWALCSLGLDNLLLKEFSQAKYDVKKLISTVFLIRVAVAVVVYVAVLVSIACLDGLSLDAKISYAITFSSVLFCSYTTFYTLYQAKSLSLNVAKIGLGSLLLSTVLKLYFLLNDFGLVAFSLSFAYDIFLNLAICLLFQRGSGFNIEFKSFSYDLALELWRPAMPMFISVIIIAIYSRVDQLMIASMIGVAESGVYSVAIRVTESYAFIPLLVATSFFSLITGKLPKVELGTYFDVVMFSAVCAGGAAWVFAQFAVPLLFGDEYLAALDVINICIIATTFSVMGAACTNYLVVMDLGYLRLLRLILGLVINVLLNLILIPRYGIEGAAYSVLISQIFASWLGNALSKSTHECLRIQTKSILLLGIPGAYRVFRKVVGL